MFSISTLILIATCLISYKAFSDTQLFDKLLYSPYKVQKGEWWRLFTSALVHGDWMHLIFNMMAFYSFSSVLEDQFGSFGFLMFYAVTAAASLIPNYIKMKRFSGYQAVGASGAISAMVFAAILMSPNSEIMFFIIPMRGWVFGILFFLISWYMYKRDTDNIGHDIHIYGAIAGLIYTAIYNPNYVLDLLK